MGAEDCCGSSVEIVLAQRFVDLQQRGLPVLPLSDEVLANLSIIFEQSGARLLTRLGPDRTKSEGEDEFAITGSEVDFSGEGDIAVFRARVFPLHLVMLGEILPAIGCPDEPDGDFPPRSRRSEEKGCAVMLGEKHGKAFMIA